MRLTPYTPALGATLPGLLTDELVNPPAAPAYVGYVTLTGFTGVTGVPENAVVPGVLTVTLGGLTLCDINGFLLATSSALPAGYPVPPASVAVPLSLKGYASAEEIISYYAALGLAAGLPARLTYKAAESAGLDFSLPLGVTAGTPYALPRNGLYPTPNGYGYAAGVFSPLELASLHSGTPLALGGGA